MSIITLFILKKIVIQICHKKIKVMKKKNNERLFRNKTIFQT